MKHFILKYPLPLAIAFLSLVAVLNWVGVLFIESLEKGLI